MIELYHCLGDLKAERDTSLLKIFTETDAYEDSVRPDCIFIVGRKGSGKSAIRRRLESDVKEANEHSEVIGPTEFTFPGLEALREHTDVVPGFPFDDLLSTVWKFTILTTAMKYVVEKPGIANSVPKDEIKAINRYLEDHNLAQKGKRVNFISTSRVALASMRGASFDWIFNAAEAIAAILDGASYDAAVASLNRILDRGIKLHLFIDDLDRDWWKAKDADAVVRFISGLVNKLYEMFILRSDKPSLSENLVVKAFVLTEGFKAVPTLSGSIIQEMTHDIIWTRPKLFELICRRIGLATGHRRAEDLKWLWARLFPERLPEEKLHLFDYLLGYTFQCPRHSIWICQECINSAADGGKLIIKDNKVQKVNNGITSADIANGIENFCAKASWEVIREGRVIIPKLEKMCKIFSGWPAVMEKDLAVQLVEESREDLDIDADTRTVIEQLFDVGFLGYKVPSTSRLAPGRKEMLEEIFWYSGGKTGAFEAAKQVLVHPLFRRRFSNS